MTFITKAFLAASTMAMAASAVPNVEPVELDADCANFQADKFFVEISNCTDTETGEPHVANGFQGQAEYRDDGSGFISIITNSDIEPTPLSCGFGSRSKIMINVEDEFGPSVGMYEIESAAQMLAWQDGDVEIPMPYVHINEDGTQEDGVFLGQNNVTTWAIRYASKEPVVDSYYALRLNVDGELAEGESEAFLKVTPAS